MAQLAYIIPVGDERPDNSLPPTDGPVDPGYGYPLPPIASHPLPGLPPHAGHPLPRPPAYPSTGPLPPTYPVDPDYGLPNPPNVWPQPPRPDPPDPDYGVPVLIRPDLPIYYPPSGNRPNNDLPLPPGAVWPPLPPMLPDDTYLCFVWIPGVGYRWLVIDTSLKPSLPMVPPSMVPQPKRD